ncbi:MAG: hypothetical protein ACXVH2_09970 [Methanobacterium sp.]
MKPVPKNIAFIVGGIILMLIANFMIKGEELEIVQLVVGFVGFAAILNGIYGFYELYKPHEDKKID